MDNYSTVSEKMANMSILCACLVCFIHVEFQPAGYGWQWWGAQMLTRFGITRMAVPFFFLASGYFLAGHIGETGWYKSAIKKRLVTLGVPLLFWNCAYMAFLWGMHKITIVIGYTPHVQLPPFDSFRDIISAVGLNPLSECGLMILWYLRCLFIFVVLSPAVAWIARKDVRWWVPAGFLTVGAILCWFEENSIMFILLHYRFCLEGLFCFAIGIALRQRSPQVHFKIWQGAMLLLVGIWCFMVRTALVRYGFEVLAYWAEWAGIVLLMLGSWIVMPARRAPDTLRKNAFPVYLLHMFVAIALAGVLGALGLRGFANNESFGFYIVRSMGVFAGAVGAAQIFRKVAPRLSSFAFGGR